MVIHSPEHGLSLAHMQREDAELLMRVFHMRYRALCALPAVRQVLLILNHGKEAGASIDHPHTQVFALPLVPRAVRDELRNARRLLSRGCPLCTALETARGEGRLVLENGTWAAIAPFAARQPYETWFVPLRHEPDFSRAEEGELRGLADILTRVLAGMSGLLADPPYNLWLHGAPCDGRDHRHYHYHLEMLPRLAVTAGFEMAGGLYINVVTPEDAARDLRSVTR